ncbi:MAG: class I SAM-dependent methyltransferase [Acidimicrobiales bacterium]
MAANPIIDEIYKTRIVRDASGNEYKLSAEVDSVEGDYLYRLISSDVLIKKTLEVGCASGLSSLHICEALRTRPGVSHVIIDPYQTDVWHGVGVANLERANIGFFRLISEPSELALPDLLRTQPESFDFIFIDGWHTFDHTMLDIFYANRLVRVGGYIAIDDCSWTAVSAAVSYYGNYPSYEQLRRPAMLAHTWQQRLARIARVVLPPGVAQMILPVGIYDRVYRRMSYPSMVVFKKIAEDTRSWTWFKPF